AGNPAGAANPTSRTTNQRLPIRRAEVIAGRTSPRVPVELTEDRRTGAVLILIEWIERKINGAETTGKQAHTQPGFFGFLIHHRRSIAPLSEHSWANGPTPCHLGLGIPNASACAMRPACVHPSHTTLHRKGRTALRQQPAQVCWGS